MSEIFPEAEENVYSGRENTTVFAPMDQAVDARNEQQRARDFLTLGPGAVAAGMAETMGNSIGLTDEGDIQQMLDEQFPLVGKYYKDNKSTVQAVGDFGGMFLPGIAVLKIYQGAGRLARAINGGRKSKLLDSIFTRSGRFQQELKAVQLRDRFLTGPKRRSLDPGADTWRKLFAKRVTSTRVTDIIKENLAFDAGVGIFMHDSDFLFPDEMTPLGNVAFALSLPAIVAAGAGLAIRRQLRASLTAVKVQNVAGLALDQVLTRAGSRDIGITMEAVARAEVQHIFDTAVANAQSIKIGGQSVSFNTIQSNANAEILVLDNNIKQQVEKLFSDKFIPELTKAQQAGKGQHTAEVKTVMEALRHDEATLLGAFSLEAIPNTKQGLLDILTRREDAIKSLRKKVDKARADLTKLSDDVGIKDITQDQLDDAMIKVDEARVKLDRASATEFYILEIDGSLIDMRMRKPHFQDGDRRIKTHAATSLEEKMWSIETGGDTLLDIQGKRLVAVTREFQIIIPPTKTGETIISNINVTKVIKPSEYKDAEYFKQLLIDMGEDWHYKSGHRGKLVFQALPRELQVEIRNWTGSRASSQIGKWIDAGDPRGQQLINAYAPMRSRLAEIADNDGTIALYRGESTGAGITKEPANDVVSMTADPEVAKRFGPQVIRKRVHIDDIIMIIGGAGREVEYIVKGNKTRVKIGEMLSTGNWEALNLGPRTAVYALLQHAVEQYKPGVSKITIPNGDHFTRLDAIIELYAKHGETILDDLQLPKGLQTIDDIQFASLSSKYLEFVRISDMQAKMRSGLLKVPDAQRLNEEDVRLMLNLPGTGRGGQMHPLQELFVASYIDGKKALQEFVSDLPDLQRRVQQTASFPQLTTFEKQGINLQGGMLNIPKDIKPVVVMKQPVSDMSFTRQYLQEAVSHERIRVLDKMANGGAAGAGLVQLVNDTAAGLEDAVRAASNVEALIQGQQRGTGLFATQAFAAGESPVLIAAHAINLAITKEYRKATAAIFAEFHPVFNKIKSPNNKGDMISFNLYAHARRQGWLIDPEPVEQNGLLFFKLVKDARNEARYKRIYGRDMPEITNGNPIFMPTPGTRQVGQFIEYQALGVTQLADAAGQAIDAIGQVLLRNNNHLKDMVGRGILKKRERWVPPRNFSTGEVAYVLTATGELVTVTHGRNLANARQLANAEAATRGEGTFVVSAAEIGRYKGIEDEAFERMLDFIDPLKQTAGIVGKQVGQFADVGEASLTDMIKGLERQFDSTLKRSLASYFEPQIRYARMRRDIAGFPEAETGDDIYSMYIRAILGNNNLNVNELVGRSFLTLEWAYDTVLEKMYDKYLRAFGVPEGIRKIHASKQDRKLYNALTDKLGEHNPFQNAVDFANKTHNIKPNKLFTSAKDHAIKINNLTSLLTLRLFEVGHSVLTLTSLGATIPGVVAAMKKTDIEKGIGGILSKEIGHEQYMARIGAFGVDVGDVAMFSPTRAITTAIHDMFTKEGHAVWKRAAEKGYMDQQVAEIFRTLTAPAEGYMEGIYRMATGKMSWLSDNAEIFARGLSFMTGHSIAKRALGLKSDDAAFAFAHHFANQVIGDYSPSNKPRIFQGAAGMPMGLFMTFMQNYYQRIFGYIENAQTRAIVTQFATQASVFGGQTIPGFQQYTDAFLSSWDGEVNIVDSMNARFGTETTEWLLNGIISNIPKMFGADDGIALYTRGDVTFRNVPTIFTFGDTPVASMFSDFYNAVRKTVGMLRQRGGFDAQQMSEIIQSYSTNRALRNMASLYSGYVTDRRGAVISSDTPSFASLMEGEVINGVALAARLMGMRTATENEKVATFARIRATDLSQRYRMSETRDAVRAEFRKVKPDPEFFTRAIGNYIKQGGSPDYLPNWFAQQYMISRVDKSALRLMEIIGNPNKSGEALRLLNALTDQPPRNAE